MFATSERYTGGTTLPSRGVAAVARLVRRKARGQVLPAGAGLQHPEDAIEDRSWAERRPALAVGASGHNGNQRLKPSPMLICKYHAGYIGSLKDATSRFLKLLLVSYCRKVWYEDSMLVSR